jgi:hypothetical protein
MEQRNRAWSPGAGSEAIYSPADEVIARGDIGIVFCRSYRKKKTEANCKIGPKNRIGVRSTLDSYEKEEINHRSAENAEKKKR